MSPNIVFVSGHYPTNTYFAMKTKELLQNYTIQHNYGFFYNENIVVEKKMSELHFIRCMTLVNALKAFPEANWFVWLDSDVIVNPKRKHVMLESEIDLSDENILYHTFHEKPWSYPINTGVKIVNKKAIQYEQEMWDLRKTYPWNKYPYEQKTLYEYIFPKLNPDQYRIHDPYVLNCILKAYRKKVDSALFIHMCAMKLDQRNNTINRFLENETVK